MYIPADGKPLLDDSRFFKPITWRPLQGDTEVKVWLRRTDAKSVDWGMEVTVKSGSAFGCFLVVRDTETGEPINLGSPVNEARVQAEKERATKTRIDGDWRSSSFSCQEGRSVTLELFQGPVTVFRKTVVP
jgi:hypothetical protein